MGNSLLPLDYDELPPGSDLRREFRDGGVRLTVAAGELNREERLRLARGAVVRAAAQAGGVAVVRGDAWAGDGVGLSRMANWVRVRCPAHAPDPARYSRPRRSDRPAHGRELRASPATA